jgi:8-oxo-dGTP diphosphatase
MEIRKVSAGVVIKDGQILMMKRKCEPYKGKWCIPGGFTDKSINESVEDCCIREIKEETGIDVEIIKKIDIIKFYNERKGRDEEIHIFLCKSKNENIIVIEEDEAEDAKWIIFDEINNLDLIPGLQRVIDVVRV